MTICLNTFNGYDGFFIHLIIRAIFKLWTDISIQINISIMDFIRTLLFLPNLFGSAGNALTDDREESCAVRVLYDKPDAHDPTRCHHL